MCSELKTCCNGFANVVCLNDNADTANIKYLEQSKQCFFPSSSLLDPGALKAVVAKSSLQSLDNRATIMSKTPPDFARRP